MRKMLTFMLIRALVLTQSAYGLPTADVEAKPETQAGPVKEDLVCPYASPEQLFLTQEEAFLQRLDEALRTNESFWQRHKGKIIGAGVSVVLVGGAVVFVVVTGGTGAAAVPAAAGPAQALIASAIPAASLGSTVAAGSGVAAAGLSAAVAATCVAGTTWDKIRAGQGDLNRSSVLAEVRQCIAARRKALVEMAADSPHRLAEAFNGIAQSVLDRHLTAARE